MRSLVEELQRDQVQTFSLDEIEQRSKLRPPAAMQLASRLVSKGLAKRIATGLYLLVPNAESLEPDLSDLIHWHSRPPYWLSHASAMAAHGLPPPLPHKQIIVSKPKVLHPRELLGGIELNFSSASCAFKTEDHPEMEVPTLGTMPVSNPLCTVLDGLLRPQLCGGMLRVAQFLALVRPQLDMEQLVTRAIRIRGAAVRRLGYLLEASGAADSDEVRRLRQALTSTYVLFDPSAPAGGRYLQAWRLRLNRTPEEIRQALGCG
jgi:predicted transcriptional regulator of viral defense system